MGTIRPQYSLELGQKLSLLGRGLDRVWPNGCKEFLDI